MCLGVVGVGWGHWCRLVRIWGLGREGAFMQAGLGFSV